MLTCLSWDRVEGLTLGVSIDGTWTVPPGCQRAALTHGRSQSARAPPLSLGQRPSVLSSFSPVPGPQHLGILSRQLMDRESKASGRRGGCAGHAPRQNLTPRPAGHRQAGNASWTSPGESVCWNPWVSSELLTRRRHQTVISGRASEGMKKERAGELWLGSAGLGLAWGRESPVVTV